MKLKQEIQDKQLIIHIDFSYNKDDFAKEIQK